MMNDLQTEMKIYQRLFPQLLQDHGRFAVIAGTEFPGSRDTLSDRLKAGYRACGLSRRFMVKEIKLVEKPLWITRLVVPHAISYRTDNARGTDR